MLAPITGTLRITQGFGGSRIASEAFLVWDGTKNVKNIGHNGIDIYCPIGTPVYAVWGGIIEIPSFQSIGLGTYIILHEDLGRQAWFGHLSQTFVTNGQHVNAGERIALSGNTGNVTGPHLHFGIREKDFDPDNGYWGFRDPLGGFNHPIIDSFDTSLF